MAIECKHGQLARSCNICALEAELAEVTAQRDKLQELINAPEVEPALVVEVEPDYWHRGHYCEGSKPHINPLKVWELPVGTKLYTAPPAPSVPDGWRPFLTDVITAAGLLEHGKRDKGLAGRIGKFAFDAMRAAPTPAEPPTDLPTWENGDDPLVGGGLISRGVVDFATVGIWPTKPAPSVPDGRRSAIAKEFPLYDEDGLDEDKHCCEWVMLQERKRLHKMLAAPTPAEAPADVARDSVASEPVGYLYTNLQSGEYHVSDADDDYRGPERVLWCIEPVYRRAKGQQA